MIAPFRTGIGYDVHQFAENRPCILGGVDIPHTHGLAGHSDADVLSHAIADAILDRLVHSAHRINLKGESMRKKLNKK